MNFLRRISLIRLLLLCGATVAVGISATAIALALGAGPVPPAKPLAQAIHDALEGGRAGSVKGYSATIKLTNHLVEGAELATGGGDGGAGGSGLASSPLLTGATGRLWVGDGKMRLELQAEKGDTQIVWDGHTGSVYDSASNTIYRWTPQHEDGNPATHDPAPGSHETPPSVAQIEEALAKVRKHAALSGAAPTDVAGHPGYTVRVSPDEAGSMIGGAELTFDADNGLPLRAAVYSSKSSAPVIELAAGEVSYGPVDPSVFQITPPANAKVEELKIGEPRQRVDHTGADGAKPKLTTHGSGVTAIDVLEAKSSGTGTGGGGESSSSEVESLPKVKIGAATASELRTELGTLLTFERAGVRYVLAGAVEPAAIEALARGL